MVGPGPLPRVGAVNGGGDERAGRERDPRSASDHDGATSHPLDTPGRPAPKAATSPITIACYAAALLLLVDLCWALASPTDSATDTPILSLHPLVGALLLGAVVTAGALSGVRTRNALVRAETAHLHAEEDAKRLLQVIDNTSALIYMRDVEGRYLLVNRTYEQLFGVRRQDIAGLTDHDLFPAEIADAFRGNDLKALARGAPIQTEELAPQADGPHTYLTIKYPIDDATGRHYAICGISTDITELKHAEREVRRLNADLEARVRERTEELEASTRELDTFAYSVSHDLRAPLRSVAGFSELLLEEYDTRLDETGRDYLRRVVSATARMSRLIDDLLKLSSATRAELSWRQVDLSAIARRVLRELEAAAEPGRRPEILVDGGMLATGDPALLELVLQNLISNAWKFTADAERPLIQVGMERLAEGGFAYVVRDNGVGFDMRYADKLFVPFQRLHAQSDFAGSGIGLAIVGRVIARHGGRIWAEGRPGAGAVFRFVLPGRRPGRGRDPGEEPGEQEAATAPVVRTGRSAPARAAPERGTEGGP